MTSDTNYDPDNHILRCPFSNSCILPKTSSICKFPNYKQCTEYQMKVKKLRPHLIH